MPVTVLGVDCASQALLGERRRPAATTPPWPASQAPLDRYRAGRGARAGRDGPHQRGPPVAGGRHRRWRACDAINTGRVVAFPLPQAQRAAQPVGTGRHRLRPAEPGADVADGADAAIADALPDDYAVLGALDPPPVVGVVLATFLPLFTMIALLTLGIGGVLVRNSITLSLEERRRQTAIVGALGGSRRLLVGGTIVEVRRAGRGRRAPRAWRPASAWPARCRRPRRRPPGDRRHPARDPRPGLSGGGRRPAGRGGGHRARPSGRPVGRCASTSPPSWPAAAGGRRRPSATSLLALLHRRSRDGLGGVVLARLPARRRDRAVAGHAGAGRVPRSAVGSVMLRRRRPCPWSSRPWSARRVPPGGHAGWPCPTCAASRAAAR